MGTVVVTDAENSSSPLFVQRMTEVTDQEAFTRDAMTTSKPLRRFRKIPSIPGDDHHNIETYTSRMCEGDVYDFDLNGLFRSQTWTTTHSTEDRLEEDAFKNVAGPIDYFSLDRRSSHQCLYRSLGISTCHQSAVPVQDTMLLLPHQYGHDSCGVQSAPSSLLAASTSGSLPPLTPPPEDLPAWKPTHKARGVEYRSNTAPPSQSDQIKSGSSLGPEITNRRLQGMALPPSADLSESSQLQKLPWAVKASRKLASILNSAPGRDSVQVVSQTLPSQALDSRSRPTFEEVLNVLQGEMDSSPYITITHAVQQARIMEELPKTPPSTPGFRQESNDYFDNDQTIFTHAAVVPIYHRHDRAENNTADQLVQHIAAPSSVHVSILERYIPPTMPEEVDDFFSISTRSYLADRLSELSTREGSLLLVYPTLAGAKTFARRYIGPVIDPYLRRFTMLNNLTSDAAALMGTMTAVEAMVDYEEMKARVTNLCQSLAARPTTRKPRSTFTVSYSETANVVLDRSTWVNWFIEQEQVRLRQNLVEYHQSGGRMPEVEGMREITVGTLTRDFIDGFPKSQEGAADAEIEVGVFLITRSLL